MEALAPSCSQISVTPGIQTVLWATPTPSQTGWNFVSFYPPAATLHGIYTGNSFSKLRGYLSVRWRCNPKVCSTHSISLCQGTECFRLPLAPHSSYVGELPTSHGQTLTKKSCVLHGIWSKLKNSINNGFKLHRIRTWQGNLRGEFENAFYHIISRKNQRERYFIVDKNSGENIIIYTPSG